MAAKDSQRLSRISGAVLLITFFFLGACTSYPDIDGFDSKKWKGDKYCCADQRAEMGQVLIANKEVLLGMNENAVLGYLGRPDENELYTRDQKFYTYYTEPSYHCEDLGIEKGASDHLMLKFNSIGKVNDVKFVEVE